MAKKSLWAYNVMNRKGKLLLDIKEYPNAVIDNYLGNGCFSALTEPSFPDMGDVLVIDMNGKVLAKCASVSDADANGNFRVTGFGSNNTIIMNKDGEEIIPAHSMIRRASTVDGGYYVCYDTVNTSPGRYKLKIKFTEDGRDKTGMFEFNRAYYAYDGEHKLINPNRVMVYIERYDPIRKAFPVWFPSYENKEGDYILQFALMDLEGNLSNIQDGTELWGDREMGDNYIVD